MATPAWQGVFGYLSNLPDSLWSCIHPIHCYARSDYSRSDLASKDDDRSRITIQEAEQVETQQPLSAALLTCSPVVTTSTPRSTFAPADRVACSLTLAKKNHMPSIELVCVDQSEPLEFADLPFALSIDREPVSHRTRPLFQRELSGLRGVMYHIGNPQCAQLDYHGAFFAYEVLSQESRHSQRRRFFEVAPEFREGFCRLVRKLLDASPVHSVFFYTDWQFGPTRSFRGGVISEHSFWNQHDTHQLKLNACYTIKSDG